jgi:outer membrane protein OmpA-like peptidoglycan-associated protein
VEVARAEAVVAAVAGKCGVAAARLIAFGNGPYAPVASNTTLAQHVPCFNPNPSDAYNDIAQNLLSWIGRAARRS